MQGVLAGFATIGIIIGLGFLLAQLKILDATAQGVLTRVAYYVASPALMVTVLGGTDVHRLLSANLIASLASVAVAATIAVLLARLLWKREAGDTVIAAFCAAYVNAGNLGLPIAAYALGDAALHRADAPSPAAHPATEPVWPCSTRSPTYRVPASPGAGRYSSASPGRCATPLRWDRWSD